MKPKQIAKLAYCKVRQFFWRVPAASDEDGKLKLHLGCGVVVLPGFLNIDAMPMRHIHLVQTVEKLSRFETASVDVIYASHVLEHLSHRRTLEILREWARVLKPRGVLRLAVPNFEVLIAMFHASGNQIDTIQGHLFGGQDYVGNAHFLAFTERSLAALLAEAGFENIRLWDPAKVMPPDAMDHSSLRVAVNGGEFAVSLNLEGERIAQ